MRGELRQFANDFEGASGQENRKALLEASTRGEAGHWLRFGLGRIDRCCGAVRALSLSRLTDGNVAGRCKKSVRGAHDARGCRRLLSQRYSAGCFPERRPQHLVFTLALAAKPLLPCVSPTFGSGEAFSD